VPICGDSKVVGSEVCDDGTDDGKGCAIGCKGITPGYECTLGTSISPSECSEVCKDGIRTEGEICDDSTVKGQGCKDDCTGDSSGW